MPLCSTVELEKSRRVEPGERELLSLSVVATDFSAGTQGLLGALTNVSDFYSVLHTSSPFPHFMDVKEVTRSPRA